MWKSRVYGNKGAPPELDSGFALKQTKQKVVIRLMTGESRPRPQHHYLHPDPGSKKPQCPVECVFPPFHMRDHADEASREYLKMTR